MSVPWTGGIAREIVVGSLLAGKYRIEGQLGSGGHGVVLSAIHTGLDIRVAVKLLAGAAATHPEHLRRFKQEAKAAASLKSERVVRILDYGALEDGTPFIAMEQLEGRSLAEVVESGERVSIPDAVDFMIQASESLSEAHRSGIVHRDIKPGNLFLMRRPGGTPLVKVLDFGAAKVTRAVLDDSAIKGLRTSAAVSTLPNTLIGSPCYMAPEQLKTATAVDLRVDVYAIGATLYELLTNQLPFGADTLAQIFARILWEPAPRAQAVRPEVPAELDAIIQRCMHKDRSHRYSSMVELAFALAPFAPERSRPVLAELARFAPPIVLDGGAASPMKSVDVEFPPDLMVPSAPPPPPALPLGEERSGVLDRTAVASGSSASAFDEVSHQASSPTQVRPRHFTGAGSETGTRTHKRVTVVAAAVAAVIGFVTVLGLVTTHRMKRGARSDQENQPAAVSSPPAVIASSVPEVPSLTVPSLRTSAPEASASNAAQRLNSPPLLVAPAPSDRRPRHGAPSPSPPPAASVHAPSSRPASPPTAASAPNKDFSDFGSRL